MSVNHYKLSHKTIDNNIKLSGDTIHANTYYLEDDEIEFENFGDVSAPSNLTSNALIKGAGTKTVQTSGISCDSSNNLTGVNSITTSSVTSTGALAITSGTNQDITIDAQGSGRVMINTVQSRGVIFGVNSTATITDQVIFASDSNLGRPALCMGVVANGSVYNPFIGSQVPSIGWTPLWIQNGGFGVIFGGNVNVSASTYSAGTLYANVFVGACNIHTGGSLSVGGSTFVDSSRNITAGTISGSTLTSSSNSLNGITIPSSGGTLAKLSDITSHGSSNYGVYSNASAYVYQWSGNTNPVNMSFGTTDSQTGIIGASSNSNFTVGATGLYDIMIDGYCFSNNALSQIKLTITVNGGSAVDNKVFRQGSSSVFQGSIVMHSLISLVANDVLRIRIEPNVEPMDITFTSLSAGEKNLRLVIRKV